jgi:hypothetical protein
MSVVAIRVPATLNLADRTARLVARLANSDIAAASGPVDRSAVIRLALARGLDVLESEHGLATPGGQPVAPPVEAEPAAAPAAVLSPPPRDPAAERYFAHRRAEEESWVQAGFAAVGPSHFTHGDGVLEAHVYKHDHGTMRWRWYIAPKGRQADDDAPRGKAATPDAARGAALVALRKVAGHSAPDGLGRLRRVVREDREPGGSAPMEVLECGHGVLVNDEPGGSGRHDG